jgi:uncharacterized membrane protein YkoI
MRNKIAVVVAVTGLAVGAGTVIASAATQAPAKPAVASTPRQEAGEQPAYSGSVKAPAEQGATPEASEADETKALQGLAKVTADQAKAAALAQYPGATVSTVQLENENGFVVYSVELTQSGKGYEVKVDAGNAKVLHSEVGGPEGSEGPETAKTN